MKKEYVFVVGAHMKKAYPIMKSMAKQGYKVVALYYRRRSYIFSRFVHARIPIPNPARQPFDYFWRVRLLIQLYHPKHIIPVGMWDVYLSREYHNPQAVRAPTRDCVDEVLDKTELYRIGQEAGVRVPFTMPKDSIAEVLLPLPWFRMGEWVTKKRHELAEADDLIYQKRIGGYGAGYFAIACGGKVLAEYAHRRICEHNGASLAAEYSGDKSVIEAGRKLVLHLKWTGQIMVEFRRDFQPFIIEVNPKFWGSLELATAWGLDFPKHLLEAFPEPIHIFYGSNDIQPHIPHQNPRAAMTRTRGGFTWVLASISALLKRSPVKWLKLVWNAFRHRHKTDIHWDDPTELLYGLVTRLWNVIMK